MGRSQTRTLSTYGKSSLPFETALLQKRSMTTTPAPHALGGGFCHPCQEREAEKTSGQARGGEAWRDTEADRGKRRAVSAPRAAGRRTFCPEGRRRRRFPRSRRCSRRLRSRGARPFLQLGSTSGKREGKGPGTSGAQRSARQGECGGSSARRCLALLLLFFSLS